MKTIIGLLGYGYSASAFAQQFTDSEHKVYGTKRTCENQSLQENNIKCLEYSLENVEQIISTANALLISIPPQTDTGCPILGDFKDIIIKNQPRIKWIAYLSSTGVYGNHDGAWVNEASKSIALNERSQLRLNVEHAWLNLFQEHQLPVHIFRLAGIYGPNRSVIDRLMAGKDFTIVKPGQFFSRVHVDDIAQALYQSCLKPTPGEIYNLCDDSPTAPDEVDHYAAQLLNHTKLKPIDFAQAELSPMAKSFYQNNRRVSNAKIKQMLSFSFQYPSYKEGLNQIVSQYQLHGKI